LLKWFSRFEVRHDSTECYNGRGMHFNVVASRLSFSRVLGPSLSLITVKPVFFRVPFIHEFHEPGKLAKITRRENLNTVAFQYSRKQKR